jgi:hypothetical protein
MDDPLKQFSFDPPRHCFITALKFVACEPVSRLKRWGRLYRLLVISTNMGGAYHRTLFSQVTMATISQQAMRTERYLATSET